MTDSEFDKELSRLESQWPNSYGAERRELLWSGFRSATHGDFHDAVSDCLTNNRQAPLLDELSRACDLAKVRREQSRYTTGNLNGANFTSTLARAAQITRANPEFVEGCSKLRKEFLAGKITHEEFLQGCEFYDKAAGIYKSQVSGRDLATGEKK